MALAVDKKILVIDDSPISRLILEDELEGAGFSVMIAENARQGIELVSEKAPNMVILDLALSGSDGLKVINSLKGLETAAALPLLVVTGMDNAGEKEAARKAGVVDLLPKPFNRGQLATLVSKHLDRVGRKKTSKILLVEDSNTIRAVTKYLLEKNGHTVIEAEDGLKGWMSLNSHSEEVDMIITDINMPNMDGRELVEKIREDSKFQFIPILVSTTISEKESIKLLLNMGADDYIVKPFSSEEFVARIQSHLRVKTLYEDLRDANAKLAKFNETLERRVRERTEELREANLDAIFSLATAAETKDEDTGNHVFRIKSYTQALAERLGLGPVEAEEIGYFSMMHDVGKLSIPDDILKKPGKLTDEEFTVIKGHTIQGERILPAKPFFAMARMIARSHHEKWNGKGYPDGLAGETIPLPARIVAVSDVFDALTSHRPYKDAWPVEKAMDEIVRSSGTHFDPRMIELWVELYNSGEIDRIIKKWK